MLKPTKTLTNQETIQQVDHEVAQVLDRLIDSRQPPLDAQTRARLHQGARQYVHSPFERSAEVDEFVSAVEEAHTDEAANPAASRLHRLLLHRPDSTRAVQAMIYAHDHPEDKEAFDAFLREVDLILPAPRKLTDEEVREMTRFPSGFPARE